MNATPPGEPATCVALSALNRGYRAPRPTAKPTSAKLMKTIAAAATRARNGSTPRKLLPTTVRISLSTRTGNTPIQNFDHKKSRRDTGDVRTIQNAAPSDDTAGNTKRTATVDMTRPAIARLTNA